jgi:hypothetical protein
LVTWFETLLRVSIQLGDSIFVEASTASVPTIDHDFELVSVDGQAKEAKRGDDVFGEQHVV